MNYNLQRERERRGNEWGGELDLAMVKRPVEDPRVRIPVPEGEPRRVLKEVKCPSRDVFPREGFVHLLKNTLPSFMWGISIVSQKIPGWSPIYCFNPAFSKRRNG
jgi:hypothetical protein